MIDFSAIKIKQQKNLNLTDLGMQNIKSNNKSSNFFDVLNTSINRINSPIKSHSNEIYKPNSINSQSKTGNVVNNSEKQGNSNLKSNEIHKREDNITKNDQISNRENAINEQKNNISPDAKEIQNSENKKIDTDDKDKKNTNDDVADMLDEIINKLFEISKNNDKNSIKLAKELSSLRESIEKFKLQKDMKSLKNIFSKLQNLIKNNFSKDIAGLNKKDFNGILMNINSILKKHLSKMNSKDTKEKHNIDLSSVQVKDILGKINNLVELLNKANTNTSMNDNNSGNNDFNFNFMKSGNINMKSESAMQNNISKNITFKQQMQSVIENAKVFVQDSKNGKFILKLFPRELGSVNVNLGLEQGVLHGKFLVESNEARDILQQNLNHVKEELAEAGISVGEFQVDVSDHSEKSFAEQEDAQGNFLNTNIELDEVSNEYDINSISVHNGSINMVI